MLNRRHVVNVMLDQVCILKRDLMYWSLFGMCMIVDWQVESTDPAAVVGRDISPASSSITFYNNEMNVKIQLQVFTDIVSMIIGKLGDISEAKCKC